jgi:hypothetical protein
LRILVFRYVDVEHPALGQSPGSRHLQRHPAEDQRPNFGRHSLWEAKGESLILGLSVLFCRSSDLDYRTQG